MNRILSIIPLSIKKLLKVIIRKFAPNFFPAKADAGQYKNEAEKIRNRTEEELNIQSAGLKEVKVILNNLGIPYYISGGTLLGAVRNGDFIKWDWDVGIDVKIEDIYPKAYGLVDVLEQNGFDIVTFYKTKTNFKINAIKNNFRYEISGLFKMGNRRYRKAYNYPDYLFDSPTSVELRGETYSTFSYPEDYLKWIYGDWRTPVKAVDKSSYVTTSSRTGPLTLFIIRFVSIFKRL